MKTNICETCINYNLSSNPCLGVRGFDGGYTWGTPIHLLDEYPSYVLDGAQSPDSPEDCIGYEKITGTDT